MEEKADFRGMSNVEGYLRWQLLVVSSMSAEWGGGGQFWPLI